MYEAKWRKIEGSPKDLEIPHGPEVCGGIWTWCRTVESETEGCDLETRMFVIEDLGEGSRGFRVYHPPELDPAGDLADGSPPYEKLEGAQRVAEWLWAMQEIRDAETITLEVGDGLDEILKTIAVLTGDLLEASAIAVKIADLFWEKFNTLHEKTNVLLERGRVMSGYIENLDMDGDEKDRLMIPWALACAELWSDCCEEGEGRKRVE